VNTRIHQAAILYGGTLLGTLLGIAVSAANARLLGPTGYGNFRFIQVVLTTSLLSLTLGVFNSSSRLIAHEEDKERYRSIIGAAFVLVAVMSLIGALLLLPFSYVQERIFENTIGAEFRLALLFVAWVPLQFGLQRILEGTNQIFLLSLLMFLPRLLYLILVLTAFRCIDVGLRGVALCYFGSFLLACMALAGATRPNLRNFRQNLRRLWQENKRFGFHMYTALLFAVVFAQLSPIVINLVGESADMGYYLLAVTITQPLALLPGIVGSSLFRGFTARETVPRRALLGTVGVSAVTLLGFLLLVRPVVRLLYSTEFLPVAKVASLLAIGACLHGFGDFFNRFLQVKGRSKWVRNASVSSGIVSLAGTAFLVPLFGIGGAVAVFLLAKALYAGVIFAGYHMHTTARSDGKGTEPQRRTFGQRFPMARRLYHRLRYVLSRYIKQRTLGSNKLYQGSSIVPIPSSSGRRQTLKGYYNVRLFNGRGQLLYGETNATQTRGSRTDKLDLMLFDPVANTTRKLAETAAWNWQQGSMLQWFANSDDTIIYNDYEQNRDAYCTRILNIRNGDAKTLPLPYYSLAPSGEFAITLDFRRLAEMRPDYGYFNHRNAELSPVDRDGIWRLEIPSGESELIVSLADLIALNPNDTMGDARHKVNHIDIAPSGDRFMFLHRWQGSRGRYTRLLTANCRDGSDLRLLWDNDMVSHSCWNGDSEILSYCRYKAGKDRYVRISEATGEGVLLSAALPTVDGHPSVSPDGKWVLTDSYPDSARNSHVYLHSLGGDECVPVGRFRQPFRYAGETRVDLHPVWNTNGTHICIDSAHSGQRVVYIIDVSQCPATS